MPSRRSPTIGLLAGLAVTLSAVAVYSSYTILQLRSLRRLQTETIDRNRTDSLLLLRIQNNLNSLALAMRDMLEQSEPYPLTAWQPQFKRIRGDLDDALAREEKISPATADQRRYLAVSVTQFWDALDRIFALAAGGQEQEARTRIRLSLQARQEGLSNAVARLLVENNANEQRAAAEAQQIHARVERNAYLFLAAMLVLIVATSLFLVRYNRKMFEQVAALSQRRSELAQQLISIQENTFRYIARELHDDFGQILTAIGYDIIHEHPNFDPAATGETSYRDFLIFTKSVENLEGGVLLCFGSAVMGPEIYLKALSMARNIAIQDGRSIKKFTTAAFDLIKIEGDWRAEAEKSNPQYYYRPWKTILVRTVAEGGESFYFCGDHRATVPALHHLLWRQA